MPPKSECPDHDSFFQETAENVPEDRESELLSDDSTSEKGSNLHLLIMKS